MNKKIISSLVTSAVLLSVPLTLFAANLNFAQPSPQNVDIQGIILRIVDIVWWVFVGVSVILFIIAGIQFLIARGDAGQIATARQFVLWGAVGVVVGVLAFSVTLILRNTFGV